MKYYNIFTLSATLAAASPHQSRRTHHRLTQQSASLVTESADYLTSPYWAGSVTQGTGATHVSGIITIPHYSGGKQDESISAWVGIDGAMGCDDPHGIWQAGFDFGANGDISPWYEWYPRDSTYFKGFAVSPGDQIRVSVVASSLTAGNVLFENLTTGKSFNGHSTAPKTKSGICEVTADWIIEDYVSDGQVVPTFNFGTISITNTSATIDGNTINASVNPSLIYLKRDGKIIAKGAVASNGDVAVTYVGNQKFSI